MRMPGKGLAGKISFWISVLIFASVLLIFSNLLINKELNSVSDRVEQELIQQNLVTELRYHFETVVSNFRAYLAFGREEFLTQVSIDQEAFYSTLSGLREETARGGTDDRRITALLDEIEAEYREYHALLDIGKELKSAGDTEALEDMSRNQSTPLIESVLEKFEALVDIQRDAVIHEVERNQAMNRWMLLLPVLFLVGAGLMGLGLVVYLKRYVIRPVQALEGAVNQIESGEYSELEALGRNDEIGRLYRGFRKMSAQLQAREQELKQTAVELIEQRDLLEAQNEEITAQQEEQQSTLVKLTEREQELETITRYQQELAGFQDMQVFLGRTLPLLVQAVQYDAALLALRQPDGRYRTLKSVGYPASGDQTIDMQLYGPAQQAADDRTPKQATRAVTDDERGVHAGYREAKDRYYPILNEKQATIAILVLTRYGVRDESERVSRTIQGLVNPFVVAFNAQLANEERNEQSLRLQSQRDLIERIIESVHEGMMLCDSQGEVIFSNRRMEEYFGFHTSNYANMTPFFARLQSDMLQSGNEVFGSHIAKLMNQTQEGYHGKFSLRQGDESVEHFELYASYVKIDLSASDAYLFVFRNRTEEAQIEEMKNEFISIVSHELRTPLSSVLGFVEIMLHRDLTKEKQTRYLHTIHNEAQRLSNLINDFLDLQRMEAGKQTYHLVPTPVGALVALVADQWQDKQGKRILAELPTEPILAMADKDRLTQVLHNLISNAVKYSPSSDRVDVRLFRRGGECVLEVQDYGLGIPEDAKDKLFSKFFRVDNTDRREIGGTGLGLAIVKEIVESHGGSISFDSELGRGSVFRVALPLYEQPELRGKVLVLEDDANLSQLMTASFESMNVRTVLLGSAEEAIHALEKPGNVPMLCIVDVHLNGKQTGWDFMRKLLETPGGDHTPVIVTTALERPDDYEETDKGKYLMKPFSVERLLELARELINGNGGGANVVLPMQSEDAVEAALAEQGLHVREMKVNGDFIEVDVDSNE